MVILIAIGVLIVGGALFFAIGLAKAAGDADDAMGRD